MNILDKEMAQILKMSIRSYHRHKNGRKLPEASEELLQMIMTINFFGEIAFSPYEEFIKWLRIPFELGQNKGKTPLEVMTRIDGILFIRGLLSNLSDQSTPQYNV